uniref:Uncharacterized protein n=1 Tax=Lygus hesperus TaxID=30085 RepID=A0A0A9YJK6_LYGHE
MLVFRHDCLWSTSSIDGGNRWSSASSSTNRFVSNHGRSVFLERCLKLIVITVLEFILLLLLVITCFKPLKKLSLADGEVPPPPFFLNSLGNDDAKHTKKLSYVQCCKTSL